MEQRLRQAVMDFKNLMNLASSNQTNATSQITKKKLRVDGSNKVSNDAVKAFVARQNKEKAKQKELEEAAKRARISARLHGKQIGNCTSKTPSNETKKHQVAKSETKQTLNNIVTLSPINCPSSSSIISTSRGEVNKERSVQKNNHKKKTEIDSKHVKTAVSKSKKCTPASKMSFEELMNLAKERTDNSESFHDIHSTNLRHTEDISRTGTTNLDKKTVKTSKSNFVDTKRTSGRTGNAFVEKKVQSRSGHRKPSVVNNVSAKKLAKAVGNATDKPKVMTIERRTISQKEYGCAPSSRYLGSSNEFFRRKRRLKECEEDDIDDMDEFIDDSEDAPETVSNYIREIFGYDRNKFRDHDDDINNMESTYKDIQKEEAKSLRIAKLEDEVEHLKETYEVQLREKKKKLRK